MKLLFLLLFSLNTYSYDVRDLYLSFSGGAVLGSEFAKPNLNNSGPQFTDDLKPPLGTVIALGFGTEFLDKSFLSFSLGINAAFRESYEKDTEGDHIQKVTGNEISQLKARQIQWDFTGELGLNLNFRTNRFLFGPFISAESGISYRRDQFIIKLSNVSTNSLARSSKSIFTPLKLSAGLRMINNENYFTFLKGSMITLTQNSESSIYNRETATEILSEAKNYPESTTITSIMLGGGVFF